MPGKDYDPTTGVGTNYLRPFLEAAKGLVTGKMHPSMDAGEQLMGNPERKLRDRSTKGSPPYSDEELKCGYRKMGKGLKK